LPTARAGGCRRDVELEQAIPGVVEDGDARAGNEMSFVVAAEWNGRDTACAESGGSAGHRERICDELDVDLAAGGPLGAREEPAVRGDVGLGGDERLAQLGRGVGGEHGGRIDGEPAAVVLLREVALAEDDGRARREAIDLPDGGGGVISLAEGIEEQAS
jgi:hypothetical protein